MEQLQEAVTIPARKSGLADLRNYLRELCKQSGIRPSTTRRIVLAVDEAMSNVMEHGRVGQGTPIEVSVEINGKKIVTRIADGGAKFDSSKPVRELPENRHGIKRGFGLYLIHLVTDSVEYERTEEGKNVLTLTIYGQ